MSRWFRLYDCVLDDPKVQRLSGDLFKTWVNLMCVASRNDGVLPGLDDLAFALRLDSDEVAQRISLLLTAGLLDELGEELTPHNWGERQFESDSSKERQARYRDRHRKRHGDGGVTSPVTAQETEQNRAETDIRDANASLPNETVGTSAIEIERPEKKALREGLQAFGEAWNELAGSLRMPSIDEIKPGSTRERHALARLREIPPDGVRGLMARIRGSPYLRGEVNGFRCTFDWIVNASNFQKIMEGNYEDRKISALRR